MLNLWQNDYIRRTVGGHRTQAETHILSPSHDIELGSCELSGGVPCAVLGWAMFAMIRGRSGASSTEGKKEER
jgi:hypothetical protein